MNLPNDPAARPASPEPPPEAARPLLAKMATGLALLTFLIFLPVVSCEFMNFDDDVFVTNNPNVAPGLTWPGIKWAFTSADIDYWRPLSWLSHMLDMELFGVVAGGHHLVNLLIHCAAVVMAFLALHRLTDRLWPSALVAALFGWHPLHVESVAWIAERKDVLCGFFFWFTLRAYAEYVSDPRPRTYLQVFFGFLLGIMSKPMIVTLPFVLLLLDFWPLRRFQPAGQLLGQGASQLVDWPRLGLLVREKLPLFAVVLMLCFSTVYSQHRVGTLADLDGLPLSLRVQTSLAAYATYLAQTFVPAHLCLLYPLPPEVPMGQWLTAALLLLLLTAGCIWRARQQPYLLVGWLWFLGMLVPIIGLVQVGEQAHADRYTYLPLNGLFIMLVWTGSHWAAGLASRQRLAVAVAIVSLAVCGWLSHDQLQYWKNGVTAFSRTVSLTQNNPTALNNLGNALRFRDFVKESLPLFEESARIRPSQTSLMNAGYTHIELGRDELGLLNIRRAFVLDPYGSVAKDAFAATAATAKSSSDPIHERILAIAQATRSRYEEASKHTAHAIQLAPKNPNILIDHAAYLAMAGSDAAAVQSLRAAIALVPTNALAHSNLGALLAKQGQTDEAFTHYAHALAADPTNPSTRHNQALLLVRVGRLADAKREFESVINTSPRHWPARQQLAWLLATRAECRDGAAAVRLANDALSLLGAKTPAQLDVMAAAHAAAGDFRTAVSLAREALAALKAGENPAIKTAIEARLQKYQSSQVHTEDSAPSVRSK